MKSVDGETLLHTLGPEYFRELSTFGALSDRVVRRLLCEGDIFELDAGEVVYRPGERTDSFYVVLRGAMNLYVCNNQLNALTRPHLRGEEFGFVAMIALHDRTATAVAAEDHTLVVKVSADQFYELHVSEPDEFGLLLLNLAREMARAVGTLSRAILQLTEQSATGRPSQ
ncbi:MAG: Crp/Fnr family transcriptional regulator [Oceanospirillaceae bacterium]|nr:Crp/Fnr family transcriptional regulator [Oceanospirillaceae bacterium]